MFLTFRDPNGVQITRNFGGTSVSTEQDLGAKEMQQGSHEGQTGMAHVARFPGCMGPTCSTLIAPMSMIFISLDVAWSKTTYKKGPLCVAKGSTAKEQKHETKAWEIKDWRGKLRRSAAGVISIPSNGSSFVTMMKREYSTSVLWVFAVANCISLLFFIVLASYELHNMIMAIFVSLLWWIFLWVIYEIAIVL
jgi:hypothetical protein